MSVWIPLVVVAVVVGWFAVVAWSPRLGAARDRLALVMAGVSAAAFVLASRGIVDWSTATPLAWWAIVLLLAAATAGAVLRWPELPPLADPARRTRRLWDAGVSVFLGVLLVAVTS